MDSHYGSGRGRARLERERTVSQVRRLSYLITPSLNAYEEQTCTAHYLINLSVEYEKSEPEADCCNTMVLANKGSHSLNIRRIAWLFPCFKALLRNTRLRQGQTRHEQPHCYWSRIFRCSVSEPFHLGSLRLRDRYPKIFVWISCGKHKVFAPPLHRIKVASKASDPCDTVGEAFHLVFPIFLFIFPLFIFHLQRAALERWCSSAGSCFCFARCAFDMSIRLAAPFPRRAAPWQSETIQFRQTQLPDSSWPHPERRGFCRDLSFLWNVNSRLLTGNASPLWPPAFVHFIRRQVIAFNVSKATLCRRRGATRRAPEANRFIQPLW